MKNNTAIYGAGAYNSYLGNCSVYNNIAQSMGGGLYGGTAANCVFTSNSGLWGGGVYNTPALNSCLFNSNTGKYGNAAYVSVDATSNMTNCIFVNNNSSNNPAVFRDKSNTSNPLNIVNCTFYYNDIKNNNGATYITNCIAYDNCAITKTAGQLIVQYSDTATSWGDTGDISSPPLFVSAPGNFHLQKTSPCVDTGTSTGAPNVDYDGTARPVGAGYDMGAYEYTEANINIFTPAAGASIEAGTTTQVTWEMRDQSNALTTYPYIAVSYSTNEGISWTTIGTTASATAISWQVPALISNECEVKVDAGKTAGVVSTSKISGMFNIIDAVAPTITIESTIPAFLGASFPLTYEAKDNINPIKYVSLLYTHNSGTSFTTISQESNVSTGALLPYTLVTPLGTNYPVGTCWFRIVAQDSSGNTATVESSHFAIDTKAPTMEVIITTESSSASVPFSVKAYDENGISSIEIKAGENAQWQIKSVPAGTSGVIQGLSPALSIAPPLIGRHPVTFEAFDAGGNMTIETLSVLLNMTPTPEITSVNIDNNPASSLSLISKTPVITASISDYHGQGYLTLEVINITSNGQTYSYSTTPESASTADVTSYTATINTTQVLQPGNVTINIEAFDKAGYVGSATYSNLNITSLSSLTVQPKVIPNPFRPRHGQGVTITYQLSTDTDIKLMIYDITGKAVFQKEFLAGSEGGKGPNYNNSFYWNGKDDFGKYVANGAYIYLITSDKKVLFKGQMAVMD